MIGTEGGMHGTWNQKSISYGMCWKIGEKYGSCIVTRPTWVGALSSKAKSNWLPGLHRPS